MTYDETDYELLCILQQIPDPRCRRGIRYRYCDLLLMCIYSVLAGHSEATEIEYYVELNFDYFKGLLKIESIPSHDTFSRIMRLTSFEKLSNSLGEWLREKFPDICKRYMGMKVLHVDGKATRGASEKSRGEKPIYHLNSMYEGESIGLEMKRVGEKENEISCLPEFLSRFNLEETIVTIDAIGCNKTVIDAIIKGKGSYVLPVKENQKKLLRTIEAEIKRLEEEGKFKKLDKVEVRKKDHGRIETMTMRMIKDTGFIYEKMGIESFYGTIARIGILDKEVRVVNDEKEEVKRSRAIIITNLEKMTVEIMMKIKEAHWNIEMQHWLLDVQLREDMKTSRKNNSITNGGIMRRFCLMIRKQDQELSEKPLKRFLMANEHNIHRIEKILFENVDNFNQE